MRTRASSPISHRCIPGTKETLSDGRREGRRRKGKRRKEGKRKKEGQEGRMVGVTGGSYLVPGVLLGEKGALGAVPYPSHPKLGSRK